MKPYDYCIPVEHLNDSNSQNLLNQIVDISSTFCLWGAVSSILTVPDGMGGIDPTGLEISGTLMLRGACGESLATGRRSQSCNSEVAQLSFSLLHREQQPGERLGGGSVMMITSVWNRALRREWH
jgi:hypothetical protein